MTTFDTETQSSLRSAVHQQLDDPDVFDEWFDDVSIRQNDDQIEFCLRNEIQARYFRERFGSTLRHAVKDVLGRDVSLVIHGEPEGDTEFSTPSLRKENGDGLSSSGDKRENGNVQTSNNDHSEGGRDRSDRSSPGTCPERESDPDQLTHTKTVNSVLPGSELSLRNDYRFEQFVVGPCNRLAHAAALAVLEQPGRAYNPLFLHGPVGLGKSHLLQALCHAVIEDEECDLSAENILYLPCEQFVNLYINGIQEQSMDTVRRQLRNVDLLVIDDVHFLANKSGTQEEFFHTFNALYNNHSQIVLSSDCPPDELASIEERLMSRFKWGLTARLEKPEWETARAIVQRKFEIIGDDVDESIQEYIARISSSIREMEGAVSSVSAAKDLADAKDSLTLDDVKQLLGQSGAISMDRSVTVRTIQKTVSDFFDLELAQIKSDDQSQQVANARHVAIYLSKRLTNHSQSEIGSFFGEKNHSSVHYAVKKVKNRMNEEPQFKRIVEHLKDRLVGK